MTPISLVIPAPLGLSRCLPYQQLIAEGVFAGAEIIIADGSQDGAASVALPGVRHLHIPGAAIYALRRAGMAHASHEWIVLTEDHCRFMPGFLDAYRQAMREHPDADLFSGAVTNESAPTPATMANFFFGYYEAWPASPVQPARAAIANLAIRKAAIAEADLSRDGGLEFLTLPRLARSGRLLHCPRAVIDHVQNGSLLHCCQGHFSNGRSSAAVSNLLRPESGWARTRRILHHCAAVALLRPLAVTRGLRGVYPKRWSIAPRLLMLGASHALGAVLGTVGGVGAGYRQQPRAPEL